MYDLYFSQIPPEAPDADATHAKPRVPPVKSLQVHNNFIIAEQTRSTNSPISEHICQAEYFVISKRVKIQEIRHVDVLHAELIRLAAVMRAARLIIVNFDSLYFESNVAVLDSSVKLRIAINEIDSCNVMCNK